MVCYKFITRIMQGNTVVAFLAGKHLVSYISIVITQHPSKTGQEIHPNSNQHERQYCIFYQAERKNEIFYFLRCIKIDIMNNGD